MVKFFSLRGLPYSSTCRPNRKCLNQCGVLGAVNSGTLGCAKQGEDMPKRHWDSRNPSRKIPTL